MTMWKATVQLLLLAAVVAHQGVLAEATRSSRAESNSSSRHLLQNQWLWTRESAAVTAGLTLVPALIANGNGAADGIKTGARGLEIARLASNKAAAPYEYDRPAAPVQKPARQQNALGRRLRSLLE